MHESSPLSKDQSNNIHQATAAMYLIVSTKLSVTFWKPMLGPYSDGHGRNMFDILSYGVIGG